MSTQNQNTVRISANSLETVVIQRLEKALESGGRQACLIGSNGEAIQLPEPVYQVLCEVVRVMAAGKAISLSPSDRELTTQEAADLLNVSRPYLIDKLLKSGEIPHVKVGNRHRIRFQDVMEYKSERDQERRRILREHTEFLQDEGFYDG